MTSQGDSIRSAAAGSNGAVTMVVTQGEIRQALAELMGIDATKGLFLLLSKNQGETPIRCGVADFRAHDGVLTADRLVLDTGVVLVTGSGDIDLRSENLNFVLNGKPKKFRLVRINAPITIRGGLTSPKVGVDIAKAAPQVGPWRRHRRLRRACRRHPALRRAGPGKERRLLRPAGTGVDGSGAGKKALNLKGAV